MTLERIPPTQARATAAGTSVVLDVRGPAEFARGHAAGAIAVPFSARGLGARALGVLPPGAAVILVAADDAVAEAAAAQLHDAGIAVRGMLAGGVEGWRDAGLPVATIGEVSIDDLPRRAAEATVIDVREPLEWATGHVPGALLIPLGNLRDSLATVARSREVIAICEAGVRSCTAASVLAAAGFIAVAHVPAGSSGYRRSGLPLAFPAGEEVAR